MMAMSIAATVRRVSVLSLWIACSAAFGTEYYNPAWSPDGKAIAFESSRDGRLTIFVVGVDGQGLRRLTGADVHNGSPTWSPDGRQIAFASARDGRLQLYVMRADGSEQRRISENPTIDYAPAWSPDGEWIAFISRTERASVMHDLCVIRPNGSDRRCFTTDVTNEIGPRWSGDGLWIFFQQNRPPKPQYQAMTPEELERMQRSSEIIRIRPDGTSSKQLTDNDAHDCCVHPGRSAVYFTRTDGKNHRVYSMTADGESVRALDPVIQEGRGSPDETRFVYARSGGEDVAGIWIYDRRSEKEHRIVFADAATAIPPAAVYRVRHDFALMPNFMLKRTDRLSRRARQSWQDFPGERLSPRRRIDDDDHWRRTRVPRTGLAETASHRFGGIARTGRRDTSSALGSRHICRRHPCTAYRCDQPDRRIARGIGDQAALSRGPSP